MSIKFNKIVDITFIARDDKKTSEFYRKVGLQQIPIPDGLQVFMLGDKELAIHPELETYYPVENPNTVYISVTVNDLQELCEHLDRQNIRYYGPKKSHLGQESIHLTDPDGNHLEIHQEYYT